MFLSKTALMVIINPRETLCACNSRKKHRHLEIYLLEQSLWYQIQHQFSPSHPGCSWSTVIFLYWVFFWHKFTFFFNIDNMSDLNHFFLHSRELSASNKQSDILLLSACIMVTLRGPNQRSQPKSLGVCRRAVKC